MVAKGVSQTIQIVNENFSPFEANDLLDELIRSRINHHKIQTWKMWEGNHGFEAKGRDKEIESIVKQKSEAIALIAKATKENLKVEIIGNIEVRLIK